jgi:hypothetical protein
MEENEIIRGAIEDLILDITYRHIARITLQMSILFDILDDEHTGPRSEGGGGGGADT